MRLVRLVAAAAAFAAALTACSPHHPDRGLHRDAAQLTPWSSIGDARLGMTRNQIEQTYGRPARTKRYTNWFPLGTKYHGRTLEQAEYAVPGGLLGAWYVGDRARVLETTSPRYETPGGIHVGLHVRGRRCAGSPLGVCARGFYYDDCTGFLIRSVANGKIGIDLQLAMLRYEPGRLERKGDRITRIIFGDADVLLTCF